jgi:hypothetical protein
MIDGDPGYACLARTDPGEYTNNPVVIRTYPCYAPAPDAQVTLSVTSIEYPFHTTPAAGAEHTNSIPMVLTNTGNTAANYTRTVNYTSGSGWLSFMKPASSSVPVGCTQTQADTLTATGPTAEGLYKARVVWNYTWTGNPGGNKADTLRVDLYNYESTNWFVETNTVIRTSYVSMATNASSRIGRQVTGAGFHYVADHHDTAYFYDGGLFLGKDSLSLSTGLFADTTAYGGLSGHGDTLLGRLFCLSDMVVDSTPNETYPNGYRHSSGKGCNKDSTIGFDVDFYASKHIDSANFMVG